MSTSTSNQPVGVQQLIDRLKSDGVEEGQQQAEALLAAAKQQAAAITEEARREADAILSEAQQEAERIQTNGKRALSLAARDASLQLKEQLQREFRGWVGALVQTQLDAPGFLADVLHEMAKQAIASTSGSAGGGSAGGGGEAGQAATAQSGKLTALVSGNQTESLDAFVKGQAAEMFRHGVEVRPEPSIAHGVRIQIEGQEVEIDFSDEAATAAMMRFLAPKFRQLIGSDSSPLANQ